MPDYLVDWPYERRLHPDSGIVDVESTNWMRSHYLFQEKAQKAFDACRFSLLGCLIYPLGSREFCRAGCDLLNVLFVIEEYTDIADPEATALVRDRVMDVLRHPYKEQNPGNKLGIYVQEFWHRALALVAPGSPCIDRFIEEMDVYTGSMIQEAKDREVKRIRTVTDYIQLRRQTIGVQPCLAFLRFGLELPEEMSLHPLLESMRLAVTDVISFHNDAHSFIVETAREIGFHNIITIAMHERQMDVDAAMRWLKTFTNESVQQFLTDKENVLSRDGELDANVQTYIDALGYVVRGTDAWTYESERYWGRQGSEIHRTKLVTLDPEAEGREGLLTREELQLAIGHRPVVVS